MAVHEGSHERVLPAPAAALEDQEQRQTMATTAEQLIESGFAEGFEKGFAECLAKAVVKRCFQLVVICTRRCFNSIEVGSRQ